MENRILHKLDEILKDISVYERKGFDASSLKIFVRNFREYLKVTGQLDAPLFTDVETSFDQKLRIIQNFLEDKKIFPTIKEVIEFANTKLFLDFRDQKASRDVTILRILSRIRSKPELKEILKDAVLSIRNEKLHSSKSRSRREVISAETYSKWAEIIKNI